MPEELEVETEKLQEAIHESLEPEVGRFIKAIALSTALLAALAAVAALQAGATVNEALMLKAEAARLQAEAADQWAFYQAKGIKTAVQEASRSAWLAAGKEPPADFAATTKRYNEEQKEIEKQAHAKERERDIKSAEADHLFHRHHGFANGVALLQVAIAVGAVAALTRVKPIWFGSLVLGLLGGGVLLVTWLQ